MPRTPRFSSSNLNELRQQLIAWRRTRAGGCRIPAAVWTAATGLARVHGAGRVGRTLRLDFYKLRERLRGSRVEAGHPTFVEVGWPMSQGMPGSGCTVELSDGSAQRLRMQWTGDAPTLVALAEAFWRRAR
jgi:hypothetical protein